MTTKRDRLYEVYRRVMELPRPGTAQQALDQFCAVLDQVEDELSGIPKVTPPPVTGGGRMYCPLADRTTHLPCGGIDAVTTGHVIHISANGTMLVTNRRTGEVEFQR